MREIIISKVFKKKLKKYIAKYPDRDAAIEYCLLLLSNDPDSTQLKLHKLKGEMKDLYSVRIDYSHRLTFEMDKHEIRLIAIGDHDSTY